MLAASLLMGIATLSGTLLSFLYDRSAPFAARLVTGTATGLALLAAIGYLAALRFDLTPATYLLTVLLIISPFLLLLRPTYREPIMREVAAALRRTAAVARKPDRAAITYVVFYCVIAILLSAVFSRAAYQTPEGIFTGVRNNLGDLTLHLQVIASFSQGRNFPAEDPTYAGVRFAYPFLADFLTAMLVRAGAGVIQAMWLQNMALALALIGLLQYWTLLLTRSRSASLIAPLLVVFSGGLGWAWIFQDLHDSAGGLVPLLARLPHDYTIMDAGGLLRWGNSFTTLFVPQRSILFGMPLALSVFCLWWKTLTSNPNGSQSAPRRAMAASGIFAGLLPLIHAHTFLVVMGVGLCLAVLFRSWLRLWLTFFALATIIALPQLLWLGKSGGVKLANYLAWQPGWDHGRLNVFLFWLLNTGLFIPLVLIALTWHRQELIVPKNVLMFYSPFLLCLIVPNLFKVAPWVWDNIKVLFWWYVASTPLVAWLLARELAPHSRPGIRWLAAGALLSLTLAGALDILRVVSGASEYREFDPDAIAIAKLITDSTPPRACILHAPTYNSPVFLTGRCSLLGYPGWMWSRGIDSSQRQAEIGRMYAGASDADALLRRHRVDYALIGPEEIASRSVNREFWSRYPLFQQTGGYRLYRTNLPAEETK